MEIEIYSIAKNKEFSIGLSVDLACDVIWIDLLFFRIDIDYG